MFERNFNSSGLKRAMPSLTSPDRCMRCLALRRRIISPPKKAVGSKHRIGDLGEAQLLEYAQTRKLDEAVVALSLLCTLPVDVVERAMLAADKEALLILAKALDLSWATTLALLFLGAPDYRIATEGS